MPMNLEWGTKGPHCSLCVHKTIEKKCDVSWKQWKKKLVVLVSISITVDWLIVKMFQTNSKTPGSDFHFSDCTGDGGFSCGADCFPPSFQCDGFVDCSNLADETTCKTSTFHIWEVVCLLLLGPINTTIFMWTQVLVMSINVPMVFARKGVMERVTVRMERMKSGVNRFN